MEWLYKTFVWIGQITRSDDADLELKLNQLGADGWELINIIPQVEGRETELDVRFNVFVLKKPK